MPERAIQNQWGLFWLLTGVASLVMVGLWSITGLSGEHEYRHMIRMSVRVAWPIFCLTFIASSVQLLWPGVTGRWLLRNRKYLGLAFSAVMLWQIFFILRLIGTGAEIFTPGIGTYFIISDLIGYTLLVAMSLTSFNVFKRKMRPIAWRYLHKTGIYYIWFIYFYSFPLGVIFSLESSDKWHYSILSASAFTVWFIRIATKLKKR